MKFTLIGIFIVLVTIFLEIFRQIRFKRNLKKAEILVERAKYLQMFGMEKLPVGNWHVYYSPLPNQKFKNALYPEIKELFSVVVASEDETSDFLVVSENPIPKHFRILQTPEGKKMEEISE